MNLSYEPHDPLRVMYVLYVWGVFCVLRVMCGVVYVCCVCFRFLSFHRLSSFSISFSSFLSYLGVLFGTVLSWLMGLDWISFGWVGISQTGVGQGFWVGQDAADGSDHTEIPISSDASQSFCIISVSMRT